MSLPVHQLASESTFSPSEEDDEVEETTLYFDAEEGTLRAENGAEVVLDMTDDSSARASEEPASQQEEEEGTRTPQAAAAQPQRTITRTSSGDQTLCRTSGDPSWLKAWITLRTVT